MLCLDFIAHIQIGIELLFIHLITGIEDHIVRISSRICSIWV